MGQSLSRLWTRFGSLMFASFSSDDWPVLIVMSMACSMADGHFPTKKNEEMSNWLWAEHQTHIFFLTIKFVLSMIM